MNPGDEPDTGISTVTVLDGKQVLGSIDCTTALGLTYPGVPAGEGVGDLRQW